MRSFLEATLLKVRVGVIGCGGIGQHHLKRLTTIKSVEIVAACDTNQSNLEQYGKEARLTKKRLFTDYRLLLANGGVDAVIICLPTHLHATVSIEAFKTDKHVFCEKPIALNFSEAKKMVEAATKSGKILQIGLQKRFRGDSQALKVRLDKGELGEIYYAKCGFVRRSGIPGWGSWFTQQKEAGAGPIFGLGVHVLDLTFWFMSNYEPSQAYASSYAMFGPHKKGLGEWRTPESNGSFDVEDLATSLIKMKNGVCVSFDVSWASHIAVLRFYVTLLGDQAGMDYETASIYTTESGYHINKKLIFQEIDPYLAEMEHFIDCIIDDKETLTRPTEILGLQKSLDMIKKSCLCNRIITANEF